MNPSWGFFWLTTLPLYLIGDWEMARWLPWWRRYAPSVLVAANALCYFSRQEELQDWIFWAWFVAYWSNRLTAWKNKRDGSDHKKLEAESARLTEVQQQSFRRQVAEARS